MDFAAYPTIECGRLAITVVLGVEGDSPKHDVGGVLAGEGGLPETVGWPQSRSNSDTRKFRARNNRDDILCLLFQDKWCHSFGEAGNRLPFN